MGKSEDACHPGEPSGALREPPQETASDPDVYSGHTRFPNRVSRIDTLVPPDTSDAGTVERPERLSLWRGGKFGKPPPARPLPATQVGKYHVPPASTTHQATKPFQSRATSSSSPRKLRATTGG